MGPGFDLASPRLSSSIAIEAGAVVVRFLHRQSGKPVGDDDCDLRRPIGRSSPQADRQVRLAAEPIAVTGGGVGAAAAQAARRLTYWRPAQPCRKRLAPGAAGVDGAESTGAGSGRNGAGSLPTRFLGHRPWWIPNVPRAPAGRLQACQPRLRRRRCSGCRSLRYPPLRHQPYRRPLSRSRLGSLRFHRIFPWRLAAGGLFLGGIRLAASGFGSSSPPFAALALLLLESDLESVAASGACRCATRFALRPASTAPALRRQPIGVRFGRRFDLRLGGFLCRRGRPLPMAEAVDMIRLTGRLASFLLRAPVWRPCPAFPAPASPDNGCPSRRWTPGRMTAPRPCRLRWCSAGAGSPAARMPHGLEKTRAGLWQAVQVPAKIWEGLLPAREVGRSGRCAAPAERQPIEASLSPN